MTKRQIQILVAIGSPLLAVWCIYDLVQMVRQRDTRDIVSAFVAAQKTLEQSPPGIERAEQFVRRLKVINTGHASAEVKQASPITPQRWSRVLRPSKPTKTQLRSIKRLPNESNHYSTPLTDINEVA